MWEVQLPNLGGPNNMRFDSKASDEGGREVPGSPGYKYFDPALELPGFKELFDELKPSGAVEGVDEERRLRAEMKRNVDADYYGFNKDEDDGAKEVECFRNVERAGEEGAPEGWMR